VADVNLVVADLSFSNNERGPFPVRSAERVGRVHFELVKVKYNLLEQAEVQQVCRRNC
jgi:hypothetical protein